MTVYTIETVQALIEEMQGEGTEIGSVWKFTNTMNKKVMFAVFPASQFCDIHQSPCVDNPVQIWAEGKFVGEYEHLNDSVDGNM